ncbi:MAG: GNAT family N-acetyltransferase [Pseudomonadota bacterium]
MQSDLKTDRLILRAPCEADAVIVAGYMADPDLPLNLGRAPYPYRLENAEAWVLKTEVHRQAGSEYAFMVCLQDAGPIGACGVIRVDAYWELGYWIGKPHWGRGYVTEAAEAVLSWAERALEAEGFISGHIKENTASGRVLLKLGFAPVGEIDHFVASREQQVCAVRYVRGAAPPEIALKFVHD